MTNFIDANIVSVLSDTSSLGVTKIPKPCSQENHWTRHPCAVESLCIFSHPEISFRLHLGLLKDTRKYEYMSEHIAKLSMFRH